MSEITQQPQEIPTGDTSSRINRIGASADQEPSRKQAGEQQQPGSGHTAEQEQEKHASHHDPAVTLASTLSKLDAGSNFVATVTGKDADGRQIISSDIGTYLVDVSASYADDIQKIPSEAHIELRVISVGKEIKAEIIRPPIPDSESFKPNIIPVSLLLTELAQPLDKDSLKTQATAARQDTPIDDVRSQYQATTLFKAERIAREISDKLDNLPLPTSSPNYTIFGASTEGTMSSVPAPKQVSTNIFVQEVKKQAPVASKPNTPQSQVNLGQILGKTVAAEVIKSVPKTPTPLPAGLPASVVKDINALTPLDYVNVGQKINIDIAAVAIPETDDISLAPPTDTPPITNTGKATSLQDTVMSGIIVENEKNKQTDSRSQKPDNEYLLATPTSVMKFKSDTPLVPGTIVSFTMAAKESRPEKAAVELQETNPGASSQQTVQTPTSTPQSEFQPSSQPQSNEISSTLAKQIEHFYPQPVENLIEEWNSISLAMSALASTNSAAASTAMMSRIPNIQTPEQFTATMFFFLSAIKVANPTRTWLGKDVTQRLTQIGADKIIEKIDADLSRIARLSSDVPQSEWRPHLIPVQNGPDVNAIPMLTKHIVDEDEQNKRQNENDDEAAKSSKRFIIEINFSQFGLMTIDGMLRHERLDIILKSKKQVPFATKMKLSRHFTEALNKSDFEGELVIIDNSPDEASVSKIVANMIHNKKFESSV
ncbi:hypothetical protein [Pseudemcibacter aquimaris]|uniref:hypothetical protein n=1 Tax=Pseudemcibacter aquimaris TaxID=2857064 RepID=UPI0020126D15|nr:hypothetical protein [Pseudemcibacter aquimaris]MCC3862217.1 hypothetical protein [Pseudemcibacter aquimaris]WDU58971.1 hypothetical protein KW060_01610 [Pseudemcibacter aquimaris]